MRKSGVYDNNALTVFLGLTKIVGENPFFGHSLSLNKLFFY